MEANYTVTGMTCGGCVRSVERALQAVLPDAKIVVSLEQGDVRISGDHQAAVVVRAIEDAGFDYGGPKGAG